MEMDYCFLNKMEEERKDDIDSVPRLFPIALTLCDQFHQEISIAESMLLSSRFREV